MPKLRVHNLAVSIDGYAAGPDQSLDNPLGARGPRLHTWVFETRTWHAMLGEEGGDDGIDDGFMAQGVAGIDINDQDAAALGTALTDAVAGLPATQVCGPSAG